jgi:hypothetical protein
MGRAPDTAIEDRPLSDAELLRIYHSLPERRRHYFLNSLHEPIADRLTDHLLSGKAMHDKQSHAPAQGAL